MADVIFPGGIPNGTPAGEDRILFSDTSDSNATKDGLISDLPISTDTQTALDGKVDKETGKGLSTNDYTTTEKNKLAGIETGAEVNNISDVNATDLTDGGETTLHTHDGRYYTETETDNLLNTKQDTLIAGTNITIVGDTISSIGGGGGSGNAGAFAYELQTATAGQTVFNLAFDYILGNNLYVYLEGRKQVITAHYLETDTNTVTFISGLDEGSRVEFIYPNKGLNYQGTYNGATAYVKDDAVYYNGSSYIAIQDTTGNLPTNITYWGTLLSNGGNMYKATYDTNDNGIVDNSEALNGETGSYYLNTDNHSNGTTNKVFTSTEKTKLSGIAIGATANDTDANLKNRANHTGTQAFETITEVEFILPITQGQSIVYDGINWINGNPTPAVGSANTFYLDATATIADNLYLNTSPSSFPQTIKSSSVDADVSGGIGFLERFVSGPLGRTDISAGTWTFNTYASTSNNTGTDTIQIRVNKRVEQSGLTGTFTGSGTTRTFTVTGGTPFVPGDAGTNLTASLIETPTQSAWISTYISSSQVVVTLTDIGYVNETGVSLNAIYYLLFNSGETADITGTSPVNYTKTTIQPAFVVNATDRIVVAYFAKTTSGTLRAISLYYGGTTAYSNIVSPLTTDHGALGGLDHDDHTQYALVSGARAFTGAISATNLSGTNTGDQTITPGSITATASQTVVTSPTYVLGNNKLMVFVNGILQEKTTHYTETSTISITFVTGLDAGSVVTFRILS